MTTPTGKAYQKRYFDENWHEDADAIGAGGPNCHDNRGAAAAWEPSLATVDQVIQLGRAAAGNLSAFPRV